MTVDRDAWEREVKERDDEQESVSSILEMSPLQVAKTLYRVRVKRDALRSERAVLIAERDALRAKLDALLDAAMDAHYLWIPADRDHAAHRQRFGEAIEAAREDAP